MPRDATPAARARLLLRAGLDQFRLELAVLTGNQAIVLVLVAAVWFITIALIARFGEHPPWTAADFYNRALVEPSLVPAIALGMTSVMGDRDSRQLEVTFVTPGGRYQVWAFRLAAITVASLVPALGLSVLTRVLLAPDHQVLAAFLHAAVPVALTVSIASLASVAFNGAAAGGIASAATVALAGFLLHAALERPRFDPFLNPFDPPTTLVDAADWMRIIVFNRCFLLAATGVCVTLTLLLLQKRERLL